MNFIDDKIYVKSKIGLSLIDVTEILSMKPLNPKFSFNLKFIMKKTTKNYRNCYVAERRKVSKLSKISIKILIAQIVDLNKDYVKISRPYLLNFPRNNPSKSVTVGLSF